MYVLRRNGKQLSEHPTYGEACKQARMLSTRQPTVYFTVHDGSNPEAKVTQRYAAKGSQYLPEYIVQPQTN